MGEWSFAPGVIITYIVAIVFGVLLVYLRRLLFASKSPKLFISLIKEDYGPWRWQAHLRNGEEEELMASGKTPGHNSAAEAIADARRTFKAEAVFESE